jgi:hypothetical protein
LKLGAGGWKLLFVIKIIYRPDKRNCCKKRLGKEDGSQKMEVTICYKK